MFFKSLTQIKLLVDQRVPNDAQIGNQQFSRISGIALAVLYVIDGVQYFLAAVQTCVSAN